MKKYSHYLMSQ